MTPQSNTPPNGDFVRYVERLTADKAAMEIKKGMLASKESAGSPESGSATKGFKAMKVGLEPLTQVSILRHVRWVFGLWVAVQLLSWFVPGTGLMLFPLLALYAAWAIFDHRQKARGTSSSGLTTPAGHIAELIAKVQKSKSNHHP